MLERAALGGEESVRMHAISELLELKDAADSEALKLALMDEDEALRSRAAASLGRTHDAGLLAEILRSHPDPLLRRRACQALVENPAGPSTVGVAERSVSFAMTRTVGTELAGRFLEALGDADEGVKTFAIGALQRYLEYRIPMPAAAVVNALHGLADDASLSSLVRDTAQEAAEALTQAKLAEPLVVAVEGMLEWRGRLAREAHGLRRGTSNREYVLDLASAVPAPELLERWPREFGLDERQTGALGKALSGGQSLAADLARSLMRGMVRNLLAAAEGVYHAAQALRLIGERNWRPHLQGWARAMETGPSLDWGTDETVAAWQKLMQRMRGRAAIGVKAALQALEDSPTGSILEEESEDADEWMRMCVLTARAELRGELGPDAGALAALCASHAADADFAPVLGPAAVALVASGVEEYIPLLESVLQQTHTDLRHELTARLMEAAAAEKTRRALRTYLAGNPPDRVGRLCLALALRGAGGSLDGVKVPQSLTGADVEATSALLCLRSMQGEQEAAKGLESALRGEDYRARYCAAVYLGLARVHSALGIFASVSDQDVPLPLRSLCGGMLIRRGHRLGVTWFLKTGQGAHGPDGARMVLDLSRAAEDVIPLMLNCNDVNVGRFV